MNKNRFPNQTVRVVAMTDPNYLDEYVDASGWLYDGPEDIEEFIGFAAKVSNPKGQTDDSQRLLKYLRDNAHWSPFEMASVTMEVVTTRDIARQLLRHRSFSFQEFSQRYAQVLDDFVIREARGQDHKNRQNSLDNVATDDVVWFKDCQEELAETIKMFYEEALKRGIAKEQARAILPEGMTPSRLYVAGTVRSWYHYIQLRQSNGTQLEHQDIAMKCKEALVDYLPNLFAEATTND